MERVQFEQEQMLAELKDLGEKGLFSPAEIKQIIKKRTAFETALVRRIPNKNDYLRYAAYEMGLEALRRKRATRMKLPKTPPSISDYALTRRQFQIFERALQKFKSDVSLWLQYLRVAQRAGSRALAGRIAARAVQLHPRTPSLYVLAASHELAHGGMAAARVLLQRGLRLNADCVDMWREYVRLELGFVEALRRRWDVLGISLENDDSLPDRETQGERIDRAEEEGMGDAARRAIMDGAIVRQTIDGAAKALPTIELFQNLQTLIAGYPAPESLRNSLLDHLHARLAEVLPRHAAAVALRATRAPALTSAEELAEDALVDALRRANEEMLAALDADETERCPPDELAGAYTQFIEEWCGKEDVDAHLKLYLIGSLHALIKCQIKKNIPSAVLLAAHVHLLTTFVHLAPPPATPSRILNIARRYTSTTPTDTRVWLVRLQAESVHGTIDSVDEAWTSARRVVPTSTEIWLWGADRYLPSSSSGSWEKFDALVADSMRDAALRDVHQSLLLRIAKSMEKRSRLASTIAECRGRIEHIAKRCLPSARVWESVFSALTSTEVKTELDDEDEDEDKRTGEQEVQEEEVLLREVYEYWRGTGEVEEATLAWAKWLLVKKKRGDEAMKAISRAGGGDGVVARKWAAIVRGLEGHPEGEDSVEA